LDRAVPGAGQILRPLLPAQNDNVEPSFHNLPSVGLGIDSIRWWPSLVLTRRVTRYLFLGRGDLDAPAPVAAGLSRHLGEIR
jgi:hypothetical protein